jgi:hypothetical protein
MKKIIYNRLQPAETFKNHIPTILFRCLKSLFDSIVYCVEYFGTREPRFAPTDIDRVYIKAENEIISLSFLVRVLIRRI